MKITSLDIWMTNCYLLETEKAAIVIDPAFKREKLVDFLKKNEHKERLILITHGHFDHIDGAEYLRDETGVKIGIGALDNAALSDDNLSCAALFNRSVTPFSADILYNDGDNIDNDLLEGIFTPFRKGIKGEFGLGLSIVKKTLDIMNYDISIKNEKKGVSFIITKRTTK